MTRTLLMGAGIRVEVIAQSVADAVAAEAGVTPENVVELVLQTGVSEVHLGAGVHDPPLPAAPVSRARVAAARQALTAAGG